MSTTTSEALKPCPFCQHPASERGDEADDYNDFMLVGCPNRACSIQPYAYYDKRHGERGRKAAFDNWNTRAPLPQQVQSESVPNAVVEALTMEEADDLSHLAFVAGRIDLSKKVFRIGHQAAHTVAPDGLAQSIAIAGQAYIQKHGPMTEEQAKAFREVLVAAPQIERGE